jgi:hypothetical protein
MNKKKRRSIMTQNTIPDGEAPSRREQSFVEQIRQLAYKLYEARGREHGHDFDDWVQAEAEIIGAKTHPTAA